MSSDIDTQAQGNNGKSVLIVEDDSIQAYVASAIVKENNYNLIGMATSGEKAIELAAEFMPDIILMDITLIGEMDGIDAATIILKSLDTKIIYITGNTGPSHQKRAKVTGYMDFLHKPIHKKLLQDALEKASK